MITTTDPNCDYPFCPKTGELSAFLLMDGNVAVDVLEIPSSDARQTLIRCIRTWFPTVDRFHTDRRLKVGSTIINGVDEASGERLIELLKSLGISGRLRPAGDRPPSQHFWNSGLLALAMLIPVALLVRGVAGFILLVVAILAPLVGAYFRRKQDVPVIQSLPEPMEFEFWQKTAEEYSEVMDRLSPADSRILESIAESVFRLQKKLRIESFTSVAAGGAAGGLFSKLKEALSSATNIAARLSRVQGEEQEALRTELSGLSVMIEKLSDWYAGVESGSPKAQPDLAEELAGLTQTIDLIISEVRPTRNQPATKTKVRL